MIDMSLVIKRIKEVSNKDEFDELKEKFKISGASLEDREEAIRLLEIEFPHFCNVEKRNKSILKDIQDGSADLPSIE